ncbi:hypothetical protein B0J12DRAFT_747690 [Macrophomina phaseolina]|uniref:Uncharacterized protein n=1 Tax=Macrophomina phaseolina TaxID=35725 RepID=A0ABQ8FPK5_9PEZI|nr:hypothetical protein B0J12DRAFT_747690 [Macrophomina phaseolina]
MVSFKALFMVSFLVVAAVTSSVEVEETPQIDLDAASQVDLYDAPAFDLGEGTHHLETRQISGSRCSGVSYPAADVRSCIRRACNHLVSRTSVPSANPRNRFPHSYRNDEGLNLRPFGSTYFEFPLVRKGPYPGPVSPGATRCVVSWSRGTACGDQNHAGNIFHTSSGPFDLCS